MPHEEIRLIIIQGDSVNCCMICKRIAPAPDLTDFIREYMLLHLQFEVGADIPVKSYPVNPEEGIIFLIRGGLTAESPDIGAVRERPGIFLFGPPAYRQNLQVTNEYLMLCVRFRPGALFRLLGIPMMEFVHHYEDAELIMGGEIAAIREQLVNAEDYAGILLIIDAYFRNKIKKLKTHIGPFEKIGAMILTNPQSFDLDRTAGQALFKSPAIRKKIHAADWRAC